MIRLATRKALVSTRQNEVRFLSKSARIMVNDNRKPPSSSVPPPATPIKTTTIPVAQDSINTKASNSSIDGVKVVSKPPPPPPVKTIVPPPPSKAEPPKKKRTFTGFLFKTLLLASFLYGTTLYVATKNDKVMDFVIDQELPYSDEIIDFIEKGSFEDIKNKFDEIKSKLLNMEQQSSHKFGELTTKLEQKTEVLVAETKKKFGPKSVGKTPAEQLQKPVEVEVVAPKVHRLPLLALPKDIDPSVKNTIQSFNELIALIDGSHIDPKIVSQINENIAILSQKLNGLTKTFQAQVEEKIKVKHTELLSDFTKKELELTETLLNQYNDEKAKLQKKLNEKLNQEIKATQETISQAAANAVSLVRIEQTKQFEQLVADKIDQERNGRLANLEKLNSRLEEVEKYAQSLETQLLSNHKKHLIHKSVNKLKSLALNYPELEQPKNLKPFINDLITISNDLNDELIEESLKNLIPLIGKESTHSILTPAQLLSRWELLTPELRSASLLPPNAGLLGHLASGIFSKLLLPVKGNKPDGKDIESVIARVEASLVRGNLDVAVEEVANLKGWPRKLSDDWVREARKRLETEFLLNVIDAESKLL